MGIFVEIKILSQIIDPEESTLSQNQYLAHLGRGQPIDLEAASDSIREAQQS